MWNTWGVRQLQQAVQQTVGVLFRPSSCDQSFQRRHSFAEPRAHRALLLGVMVVGMNFVFGIVSVAQALERLSDEAIAQRMQALPGWAVEEQKLICRYQFENFVESVAFVNQLVEPAELANHHPDLTISYNTVMVMLTTHDADGLTALDFDLAETIASVADRPCLDAS